MKYRLLLIGVLAAAMLAVSSTASAKISLAQKKHEAKVTYYHTNGYMSAIWKNARRTVYHPNLQKRLRWWSALKFLQARRDSAWLVMHPPTRHPVISKYFLKAFGCIHHYEGAWNANTGNGYYGGLQMDRRFQSLYGSDYMARWGTADNWPSWAQLNAAVRAVKSGRGFYPWPSTARACGLI